MENEELKALMEDLLQFSEVCHGDDLPKVKEMHKIIEDYWQEQINEFSDVPYDDYSSATSSN